MFTVLRLFISALVLYTSISLSAQTPFITTWKTDNMGTSGDDQIRIPTALLELGNYNYNVYWEDVDNANINGTLTEVTNNVLITFPEPGTYRIEISGQFPRIEFNNLGDRQKLLSIEQWGDIAWTSMQNAFYGCSNLVLNATDAPDLSNVTNLAAMFRHCFAFNSNINHWDVSNVTNMDFLFAGSFAFSAFNQPLDQWDVSNVTSMASIFNSCNAFNQDISMWDVSNVTDLSFAFAGTDEFNQPLGGWNVSSVTLLNATFQATGAFNQNINDWDVSNVTSMVATFAQTEAFNQPLDQWDVSNVTTMFTMFNDADAFDQPIGMWDVSSVTDMSFMFQNADVFNQDISAWNVSNVTTMLRMFERAVNFNQPLEAWDVSNVTNIGFMFNEAEVFNQPLNNWNVSSVTDMRWTFHRAYAFNQPLDQWDVSNVTIMQRMFQQATSFDQNLGMWEPVAATNMQQMFLSSGLSPCNYDALLNGWQSVQLNNGVQLSVSTYYTPAGEAARQFIIDTFNWSISDFGLTDEVTFDVEIISVIDPSCFGANDGEIAVVVGDEQDNLTFEWVQEWIVVGLTPSVDGLAAGVYTLNVSDPSGCGFSQTVELVDPEIITIVGEVNEAQVSTTASGGTGTLSYAWEGPGGFTANTPEITAPETGLYTLTVTDENNCSVQEGFSVTVVSIVEPGGVSVEFYPNPASDVVHVVHNGAIRSVALIDLQGRLVATFDVLGSPQRALQLPDLRDGIYLLRFEDTRGVQLTTRRLIIRR